MSTTDLEQLRTLSERLAVTARSVRVLDRISWPHHVIEDFLRDQRAGNTRLPVVEPEPHDVTPLLREIEAVERLAAGGDSPELAYVAATAHSYADAARLVLAIGTPAFVEHSRALYGTPADLAPGGQVTRAELARRVLTMTEHAQSACVDDDGKICLTAEFVKAAMQPRIDAAFGTGGLEVRIEPDLGPKAAASVRRVRLRGGTCFSEADIDQLLEHEVMVHSATARNGLEQPWLTALSLGAPRTTATQEGLATFAELITGAMDVSRLRRIALRILAVQSALDGADFVDIYRLFLAAGQSEEESALSAVRVFRGADPTGNGVVFTKDAVYLAGLFAVHTFFRKAISEGKLHLVSQLFAGRMALGDVLLLEEGFVAGRIAPGRVLPRWVADPRRLAAYLAFSAATNPINLDGVDLDTLTV